MSLDSQESITGVGICASSLANVFKSAGDSLRLDILKVLDKASFGVQELAHIFAMAQPGMSHHLKVLAKAGLIVSRREGNSLFYRRPLIEEGSPIRTLLESLFASIDQIELSPEILQRMSKVHQDRAAQSQNFFKKNAEVFAEKQGRIVSFDQYSLAAEALIKEVSGDASYWAVEVGPGKGELLGVLAKKFEQVLALDNSPEMLKQSQLAAQRQNLKNVSFMEGDLEDLPEKDIGVDLLALNMVLHHMPSPADTFNTLKRVLKPGGVVFIAELCLHDQEWVKDSCGDIWMGFRPDELDAWAMASGLQPRHSQYIGMKNGFQVQLKTFFNIDKVSNSFRV